jgi:hypothetical protein
MASAPISQYDQAQVLRSVSFPSPCFQRIRS